MKWGMADLAKFREEFDRRLQTDDYYLGGKDGTCFIVNDEILKIYWASIDKVRMCDLSKYKSDRIAFPKYYIEKRGRYHAEVMPYFPYENIYKSFNLKTDFQNLINNYNIIKNEICKFSDIHMNDLGFGGNILYSNEKGFYLIDTTSWEDEEWTETEKANIRQIDKALFNTLLQVMNVDMEKAIKFFMEDYEKLKESNIGKEFLEILYANLHFNYNFENLVKAYQEVVKYYFNGEVKKIEDVKTYGKKLKGI